MKEFLRSPIFLTLITFAGVAFGQPKAGMEPVRLSCSRLFENRQKFLYLIQDSPTRYMVGRQQILVRPAGEFMAERDRYMSREQASLFLAHFNDKGQLVDAEGSPRYGEFNFVLTDDDELYIFRPGPRYLFPRPNSYRHTYPVRGEPVAAAGEMFFSVSGRLVAVNPSTGHYRIDADLSNFQIKQELQKRRIPLSDVRFLSGAFPRDIVFWPEVKDSIR